LSKAAVVETAAFFIVVGFARIPHELKNSYSGILVGEPFGFGISNYVLVLSETVLVIVIECGCRLDE
jgi:hypothetical protein